MRNMNLTPRPRDLTALLTGGRPAPADTGRPESAETEIPKNRKTVKPNDVEGWVKTSVSLRASTRRRLKTFAAEHDMRIQEVVDAASKRTWALEGNDEPRHAPRTAGLHLSRGIVRSDGRDGRNRRPAR